MDPQALFNAAFGLACGLGGFILKATWDALEKMRSELQQLQSAIAATYVRKDDFNRAIDRLLETLQRIEDKLDSKVDR